MEKKYFKIKNKIVNRIMIDGKKNTSEKLFLKSFKKLQISSTKQIKKVLQLCLISAMPIFKLNQSSNKKIRKRKRKVKIVPVFINKQQNRMSLGIKFILFSLKKKSSNYFYTRLASEILLIAKNKSALPEIKIDIQKKAILNKRYFKNYRW